MGHVEESYNSVSAEYVISCYGLFTSYLISKKKWIYFTVQPKEDDHKEEEDRPKLGQWHHGYCSWIGYKSQTRSLYKTECAHHAMINTVLQIFGCYVYVLRIGKSC